jgi:hypothetical protein
MEVAESGFGPMRPKATSLQEALASHIRPTSKAVHIDFKKSSPCFLCFAANLHASAKSAGYCVFKRAGRCGSDLKAEPVRATIPPRSPTA